MSAHATVGDALRRLVEELSRGEVHAADNARQRSYLWEAAEEHARVLRRSRELGDREILG